MSVFDEKSCAKKALGRKSKSDASTYDAYYHKPIKPNKTIKGTHE